MYLDWESRLAKFVLEPRKLQFCLIKMFYWNYLDLLIDRRSIAVSRFFCHFICAQLLLIFHGSIWLEEMTFGLPNKWLLIRMTSSNNQPSCISLASGLLYLGGLNGYTSARTSANSEVSDGHYQTGLTAAARPCDFCRTEAIRVFINMSRRWHRIPILDESAKARIRSPAFAT